MRRLRVAGTTIATSLLVLSLACSDDDKQVQQDAAVPDIAVKDDMDTTKNDGSAEASAGDIGPDAAVVDMAPDKPPTPDMPAASANWAAMKVKPSQKLYAVGGKSKTAVYAAGAKGLLMKYDGTNWTTMTNPDTGKTTLTDIHINKDYTYAYGNRMILYLSGSAWKKGYVSSYGNYYAFVDVWGPATSSTQFGVGEMGYYFAYKTSSSTSSSWSSISMGSSKLKNSMYGVWGSGIGDVHVVGDNGKLWHCSASSCAAYSSSNWTAQTSPTTSHMKAIWGADKSNVFAVGLNGTILKYDGTSWKKMTTNTYTYFYGVWGTSATDVWAVGHPIFKKDEAIFHYNGTKWTKVPPPGQPYLNAVWGADKDNVFVVGNADILKLKKHPK